MRMGPLVLIGLLALPTIALSQEKMPAVRKGFDDCFYNSLGAQIQQNRQPADINMMSELAFQGCATEQRAIELYLSTNGLTAETISAAILKIRLQLKGVAREIAANPKKFIQ